MHLYVQIPRRDLSSICRGIIPISFASLMRRILKLETKPPFVIKPLYFDGWKKITNLSTLTTSINNLPIDELFYHDCSASILRRKINPCDILELRRKFNMPISVAGHITCVDDARLMFQSGADKISINTYFLESFDVHLLNTLFEACGHQSVSLHAEVASVDGIYYCYSNGGKEKTSIELETLLEYVNDLRPGEFIFQSVSYDGSMKGPDIRLIDFVSSRSQIPLVYGGGISSTCDFELLTSNFDLSGVMAASFYHTQLIFDSSLS